MLSSVSIRYDHDPTPRVDLGTRASTERTEPHHRPAVDVELPGRAVIGPSEPSKATYEHLAGSSTRFAAAKNRSSRAAESNPPADDGPTEANSENERAPDLFATKDPAPDATAAQASEETEDAHSPHPQRGTNGQPLSDEELREIADLEARDREVRTHEQAHKAAAGSYAGAIHYEYRTGPDAQRYVVDGHVPIDLSDVPGDAAATERKMQAVRRAALAPAQPSAQDRQVAAQATQRAAEARQEVREERAHEGQDQVQEERTTGSDATRTGTKPPEGPALETSSSNSDARLAPRTSPPESPILDETHRRTPKGGLHEGGTITATEKAPLPRTANRDHSNAAEEPSAPPRNTERSSHRTGPGRSRLVAHRLTSGTAARKAYTNAGRAS